MTRENTRPRRIKQWLTGVIRTMTFMHTPLAGAGVSERLAAMDVTAAQARLIRLRAERFQALELGGLAREPAVQ